MGNVEGRLNKCGHGVTLYTVRTAASLQGERAGSVLTHVGGPLPTPLSLPGCVYVCFKSVSGQVGLLARTCSSNSKTSPCHVLHLQSKLACLCSCAAFPSMHAGLRCCIHYARMLQFICSIQLGPLEANGERTTPLPASGPGHMYLLWLSTVLAQALGIYINHRVRFAPTHCAAIIIVISSSYTCASDFARNCIYRHLQGTHCKHGYTGTTQT